MTTSSPLRMPSDISATVLRARARRPRARNSISNGKVPRPGRAISAAGRAWMPCACSTTTASLTTTPWRTQLSRPLPRRAGGEPLDFEQRVAAVHRALRVGLRDTKAVGVRDDDRSHETRRRARHQIQVEAQQQVAGTHAVAPADVDVEATPARPTVSTPTCTSISAPLAARNASA